MPDDSTYSKSYHGRQDRQRYLLSTTIFLVSTTVFLVRASPSPPHPSPASLLLSPLRTSLIRAHAGVRTCLYHHCRTPYFHPLYRLLATRLPRFRHPSSFLPTQDMFLKLSPAAALILQFYTHTSTSQPISDTPNALSTPSPLPLSTIADISSLSNYSTIRALSQAPFLPTYQHKSPFLASIEAFFEDNPLLSATLKPATQQRYAVALDHFRSSSIYLDQDDLSLDQRLSIYIQERFMDDPRPGKRQEMANLFCALLLMFPNLKHDLGLARRCLAGWKTLHPARAAAPLTKLTTMVFAYHMLEHRRPASAITLIMSYCACLRISEALSLKWDNVALPGDVRLEPYGPLVAGINIVDAKTSRYTGDLQFVQIHDPDAVTLLQTLHASPNRQEAVAKISYQAYSTHLKEAAAFYGFTHNAFTTHSARIGKATEDYIRGVSVEQIAINGRWKSINSLRYYLTNGRAWILQNRFDPDHQTQIRQAAAQLTDILRMTRQTAPPV